MSEPSKYWIYEEHRSGLRMGYLAKEMLFEGQSPFQKVTVYDTQSHGKMLFNDDLAMVSERDEFIYHDMISHPALFVHPNPRRVLVIGGGDGGTAREVMRHKNIEICVMVEIDQMVIDACIAHIPQTAIAFQNPKMELHVDDGVVFVQKYRQEIANGTQKPFDVILVDSTDPIGPAQPLFDIPFYDDLYHCLGEDGIVISQGESSHYEKEAQVKLLEILQKVFPICSLYNFHNLTYPGGFWSFTFASKTKHPIRDFDATKVQNSGLEFQYYNPQIHQAAFCKPNFQEELIGHLCTGSTDI